MNSLDLPIDRSFAKRLNVERLCNAENMQWEKNLDLHLHFVSTTGWIASYLYLYIFPYLYFIFIFIFFLYLVALFLIFIIVVAVGALYWSENPIETFQISGKYTKYYKYLAYTQNISNNRQIRSGLGSKSRLREKFTVRSGRDLDEVQDQRQGDKSWAKALARLALVSKKKGLTITGK